MADQRDEIRNLVMKYKAEIAHLEEIEEGMARRIQIMENMVPTVLVWLMWKSSQEKKKVPFPQGQSEEEAQKKLLHLETILEELQEAEYILKAEEAVLRKRIEELELDFKPDDVGPHVEREIAERSGKIREMEIKGMKFTDLIQDSNTDWQTACEQLCEQVEELTDNLNQTTKNLKESEEYIKSLEERFSDKDTKVERQAEAFYRESKDKERESKVLDGKIKEEKELSFDQDVAKQIKIREEILTDETQPTIEYDSEYQDQIQDQRVDEGFEIKTEQTIEPKPLEDVQIKDESDVGKIEERDLDQIKDVTPTVKEEEDILVENKSEMREKDVSIKDEQDIVLKEVQDKIEDEREITTAKEEVLDQVENDSNMVKREEVVGQDEGEMMMVEDVLVNDGKETVEEALISVEEERSIKKADEDVLDQTEDVTKVVKEEKTLGEDEIEKIVGEEEAPVKDMQEKVEEEGILSAVEDNSGVEKTDGDVLDKEIVREETLNQDENETIMREQEVSVKVGQEKVDEEESMRKLESENEVTKEENNLDQSKDESKEEEIPSEMIRADDTLPVEATRELATLDQERPHSLQKSVAESMEAQAITSEPFEVPSTDVIPALERSPSGLAFEKEADRLKARPSVDSLTTQTLQSKCRVKDHLIKSMADQLKDLAKKNVWSGNKLLENMSEDPVKTYDFNRTTLFKYLKGEEPPNFAVSMKPNDSYKAANPLNVKILRKLDKDSLLIEWGPPPSSEVVGFQIFINGEFMYWVHSAKRNKALLHPLDLYSQLEITVSPVDEEGNTVYKSSLMYNP